MYIPKNTAQEWRELLIMGTVSVHTQKFSIRMADTPNNGHSSCIDMGTWFKYSRNTLLRTQQVCRPGNSAQG